MILYTRVGKYFKYTYKGILSDREADNVHLCAKAIIRNWGNDLVRPKNVNVIIIIHLSELISHMNEPWKYSSVEHSKIITYHSITQENTTYIPVEEPPLSLPESLDLDRKVNRCLDCEKIKFVPETT